MSRLWCYPFHKLLDMQEFAQKVQRMPAGLPRLIAPAEGAHSRFSVSRHQHELEPPQPRQFNSPHQVAPVQVALQQVVIQQRQEQQQGCKATGNEGQKLGHLRQHGGRELRNVFVSRTCAGVEPAGQGRAAVVSLQAACSTTPGAENGPLGERRVCDLGYDCLASRAALHMVAWMGLGG